MTIRPATPFTRDYLRRVIFTPYRKGMGPSFTLTLWDTYTRDHMGKSRLAYRLTQREGNKRSVIFQGQDICCSPMHAIDSNDCVKGVMTFLTLKPGDTDSEYFENYTEKQKVFASHHAESLDCEVRYRMGDED